MANVVMHNLLKNESRSIITVRLEVKGKISASDQTMMPGDTLSFPKMLAEEATIVLLTAEQRA